MLGIAMGTRGLAVVLLFALLTSCREDPHVQARTKLDVALADTQQADSEELIRLCKLLGAEGAERVRAALLKTNDISMQMKLLNVLLRVDPNRSVVLAIETVARSPNSIDELLQLLQGRLDATSRELIHSLIRERSGQELIVALKVLQLICDDKASLELLTTILAERSLSDEETMWCVLVLGTAAY